MAVYRMKDLDLDKVKTSMDNHRGSEKFEVKKKKILLFDILFHVYITLLQIHYHYCSSGSNVVIYSRLCVIFTRVNLL